MINKKATKQNSYNRDWIYTNSAREAWSNIIEQFKLANPVGKILLPSYIGWSPNEGSGIFDSVTKSGLDYDFYDLDLNLNISVTDLKQKVHINTQPLVLIVHYFGFIDQNYEEITEWLTQNNIFFVEDCAHAWLTDLIGGKCGRKGKYSFYSLHKLLPLTNGGLLVSNGKILQYNNKSKVNPSVDLGFDLFSIFEKRRNNYKYLAKQLVKIRDLDIIYPELNDGVCPQTLPVIVNNYNRDKLYHEMNELGFGAVSLYHTMIEPLRKTNYQSVTILSNKIINLPIHQDVEFYDIDEMVIMLNEKLNV